MNSKVRSRPSPAFSDIAGGGCLRVAAQSNRLQRLKTSFQLLLLLLHASPGMTQSASAYAPALPLVNMSTCGVVTQRNTQAATCELLHAGKRSRRGSVCAVLSHAALQTQPLRACSRRHRCNTDDVLLVVHSKPEANLIPSHPHPPLALRQGRTAGHQPAGVPMPPCGCGSGAAAPSVWSPAGHSVPHDGNGQLERCIRWFIVVQPAQQSSQTAP